MGSGSWMAAAWSGRQEQASGRPSGPGPAEQLACAPRQAVDGPCDRALTPGQPDGGVDGSQVRPEPSGKTPEGREGTRGGTFHPGFELTRLTRPDQASKVLRQCRRLCQLRGLRSHLHPLAVIVVRGAR